MLQGEANLWWYKVYLCRELLHVYYNIATVTSYLLKDSIPKRDNALTIKYLD